MKISGCGTAKKTGACLISNMLSLGSGIPPDLMAAAAAAAVVVSHFLFYYLPCNKDTLLCDLGKGGSHFPSTNIIYSV